MKPYLFIMLKAPQAGRVKTRLAHDIGCIPATWWFRHQSRALIRKLAYDRRWHTILAISPDNTLYHRKIWPINLARWAQGQGDLGARMGRILRHGPMGPKLIIGADIPALEAQHIAEAFAALKAGRRDAVIGPAPDGGYWAIGWRGLRRPCPQVFDGVRWSSVHARKDSLKSLKTAEIAHLRILYDVDTGKDLHRSASTLSRPTPPPPPKG